MYASLCRLDQHAQRVKMVERPGEFVDDVMGHVVRVGRLVVACKR